MNTSPFFHAGTEYVISGVLAPSTKLRGEDVTQVFCFIFGIQPRGIDITMVHRHLENVVSSYEDYISHYEATISEEQHMNFSTERLNFYTTSFEKHEESTAYLLTKEASGCGLLATLLIMTMTTHVMQLSLMIEPVEVDTNHRKSGNQVTILIDDRDESCIT